MSTRDDVSLSAQERQVLAHLEARARHDDPALAARLRGHPGLELLHRIRDLRVPHLAWWAGPVLLVAGLALTVGAVAGAVWLSVVGVAVCMAGACRIGLSVRHRVDAWMAPAPERPQQV